MFLSLWDPLKVSAFSLERPLEKDYQYIHKLLSRLFGGIKPHQGVPFYSFIELLFFVF